MLVAIISDIHNNEVNLKKVLDYCVKEDVKTIICCGDLASLETLDFLNANFSGNILLTFGNAEYDDIRNLENQKKYKQTFLFKDFGELEVPVSPARGEMAKGQRGGRKIAFVHYPNMAKSLARTGKYDFIFYGHTHKPWVVSTEAPTGRKYTLLNPGTTSGEIYPPTFAVWETDDDNFKLIRVHELK
jgi:hypothetical protein